MASFPVIRAGSPALHPAALGAQYATFVMTFEDGSEQRAPLAGRRARFTLVYRRINGYELSQIEQFFRSMKGAFDKTWDIAIDGVTYDHLAFDTDRLEAEQYENGYWRVELPVVRDFPG